MEIMKRRIDESKKRGLGKIETGKRRGGETETWKDRNGESVRRGNGDPPWRKGRDGNLQRLFLNCQV